MTDLYTLVLPDGTRCTDNNYTLEGAQREVDLWFEQMANCNPPEIDLMALQYPWPARVTGGKLPVVRRDR